MVEKKEAYEATQTLDGYWFVLFSRVFYLDKRTGKISAHSDLKESKEG